MNTACCLEIKAHSTICNIESIFQTVKFRPPTKFTRRTTEIERKCNKKAYYLSVSYCQIEQDVCGWPTPLLSSNEGKLVLQLFDDTMTAVLQGGQIRYVVVIDTRIFVFPEAYCCITRIFKTARSGLLARNNYDARRVDSESTERSLNKTRDRARRYWA